MKIVKRRMQPTHEVLEYRDGGSPRPTKMPGRVHTQEECRCGYWYDVEDTACPQCGYRPIRCSACGGTMVETEDGHGCVPCDREITA